VQQSKPVELTETKASNNPDTSKENPEQPSEKVEPKPLIVTPKPQPEAKETKPEPKPKDTPMVVTPPPPETTGGGLKEVGSAANAIHAGVSKPVVQTVSFKQVLPILRTYCFECHGGSTGKPKGDVDVTSIAKMLKSKGPPLVPGKPEDSTIYTSTASGDMPKDRKGPDSTQLKLLHDWIASGAKERRRIVRRRMPNQPDHSKLELTGGLPTG
jgi:hypothetical protein